MAGPYSAKLVSVAEGVGNENIVSRLRITDAEGNTKREFDFPSNTAKPEDIPVYMEMAIKEIEEKEAGLAKFAALDLSTPVALVLPRDEPDSPINAFFVKLAVLRERFDEYNHGLIVLDDPELLAARAEAKELLKPEYKKDPRWFR